MSTQVFVQIDGIVNHKHEGVKGWHDPAAKHKDGTLHSHQKVEKPTNLAELTEEQKQQYAEALAGKSLMAVWKAAKEARVAAGKVVRGPGKAKAAEAVEALKEAQAIAAEAFEAAKS